VDGSFGDESVLYILFNRLHVYAWISFGGIFMKDYKGQFWLNEMRDA
jgi:hypothetical protein